MPFYKLPKRLHPDFAKPGIKPAGRIKLDRQNRFSDRLMFFGIVVDGGLFDVVHERFYSLPNATIKAVSGELAAHYAGVTSDSLTPAVTLPWQQANGLDGERSAGCRGTRTTPGGSGDKVNIARFISDAPAAAEDIQFNTNTYFTPANGPYDVNISLQVGWGLNTHNTTADPIIQNVMHNLSVSANWRPTNPRATSRGFENGNFISESTGNNGDMPHTEVATIQLGNYTTDDTAECCVSAVWFIEGELTDAEQREFNDDIWQVLAPAEPVGYFVPAAGGGAFTIAADAGAFAITGSDANLEHGRTAAAEAGAIAITGSDANLEHARSIAAEAGAIAINGSDATLRVGFTMSAEPGAIAIAGSDANLEHARSIAAEAGAYSIIGLDATLTHSSGITLDAEAGAIAITGADANLEKAYRLDAEAGAWSVNGVSADLRKGQIITAEGATYSIVGNDVGLLRVWRIDSEAGAYAITGLDANLISSLTPDIVAILATDQNLNRTIATDQNANRVIFFEGDLT